jgi:hypothetical protein
MKQRICPDVDCMARNYDEPCELGIARWDGMSAEGGEGRIRVWKAGLSGAEGIQSESTAGYDTFRY